MREEKREEMNKSADMKSGEKKSEKWTLIGPTLLALDVIDQVEN